MYRHWGFALLIGCVGFASSSTYGEEVNAKNTELCKQEMLATDIEWHKADLTTYTSYPDLESEECIKYSGCKWEGRFAFVNGKKSKRWVVGHNIAAMREKEAREYQGKTLCLLQNKVIIAVTVYDACADSDCNGCCSNNSASTGHLIDLEENTAERFGSWGGIVKWRCLDC